MADSVTLGNGYEVVVEPPVTDVRVERPYDPDTFVSVIPFQGKRGPAGPEGPEGQEPDIPDLATLFENGLN